MGIDVKAAVQLIKKEKLKGQGRKPKTTNNKVDRIIKIVEQINAVDNSGKNPIQLASEKLRSNIDSFVTAFKENGPNKVAMDKLEEETGMRLIRTGQLETYKMKEKKLSDLDYEYKNTWQELNKMTDLYKDTFREKESSQKELKTFKEVPEIPSFVADFYERYKGMEYLQEIFKNGAIWTEEPYNVNKWLDELENEKKLIQIFLYGKYKVEKERKYYVEIGDFYLYIVKGNYEWFAVALEQELKLHEDLQYVFTEKEISAIDPRYLDFKQEVTGLNEKSMDNKAR